ncbi:MAG: hypothetical protein U0R78_16540, partial [Nocardioidaceae bacterium]
ELSSRIIIKPPTHNHPKKEQPRIDRANQFIDYHTLLSSQKSDAHHSTTLAGWACWGFANITERSPGEQRRWCSALRAPIHPEPMA